MSGYNTTTGIFELTQTKAGYWLRRTDTPIGCEGKSGMEYVAALFSTFGFEVQEVRSNWLTVKANPDQVWEVLSGQPSNPERSKHHYKPAANLGTRTQEVKGKNPEPGKIVAKTTDKSTKSPCIDQVRPICPKCGSINTQFLSSIGLWQCNSTKGNRQPMGACKRRCGYQFKAESQPPS